MFALFVSDKPATLSVGECVAVGFHCLVLPLLVPGHSGYVIHYAGFLPYVKR